MGGRHGQCRAVPDAGDPRGQHDALGCLEEEAGVDEGVPSHGLREPDGPVAQGLEVGGQLLRARHRLGVEVVCPDADRPEVHGFSLALPFGR